MIMTEPNLPQLTRATYNICDVIEHTLGVSIPREEILGVACSRYNLICHSQLAKKVLGAMFTPKIKVHWW